MTEVPTLFDHTIGEVRAITQEDVDMLISMAGAYAYLRSYVAQALNLTDQFKAQLSKPSPDHLEISDEEVDKWCQRHGIEPPSQRMSRNEKEMNRFLAAVRTIEEFGYEAKKCRQN